MSQGSHHGNTPAAWTAVAVSTIGFVVGSIGVMMDPVNITLLVIGLVLAVVGLPIFFVMTKMGLGEPQH